MAHQARRLLDRWTWPARTWFTRSADGFTSLMVEKYGEAFYSLWSPWEQQRYATLRLAKDDVENLGQAARYNPWAAVSLSVAVVLLAVFNATQSRQESSWSTQQQVVQDVVNRRTQAPGTKKPDNPAAAPFATGAVPLPNESDNELPAAESDNPPSQLRPRPEENKQLAPAPRKLSPETVQQARSLDRQGRDLYAKGNYVQAARRFQEIIKIGCGTATTHNNLGCCLYQTAKDNQAPAVAEFSKAIALDPKNATVFENRGTAFYQDSKQIKSGRADFTTAAEMDVKRRLEKPGAPPGEFFDLKHSRTNTHFRPILQKRRLPVRVNSWQRRTTIRRP